jgi:hypothetical protein
MTPMNPHHARNLIRERERDLRQRANQDRLARQERVASVAEEDRASRRGRGRSLLHFLLRPIGRSDG